MRKIPWKLAYLLVFLSKTADAQSVLTNQLTINTTQQLTMPRWDMAVTAGVFQANPKQTDEHYGDDWYFQGRYGVSIGRFWTDHLKTELEFAATGEGTRYSQRYSTIPGVPPYYPINVQEHFQLTQVSGRVVWQFFENRWVHPYVFGGASFEAERQRVQIPEQYFYASDPRNPSTRIPISLGVDSGPETHYRAGAIAGIGTKVYMSPRSYFNTNLVMSQARPSRNVSFIAGFGWDF